MSGLCFLLRSENWAFALSLLYKPGAIMIAQDVVSLGEIYQIYTVTRP